MDQKFFITIHGYMMPIIWQEYELSIIFVETGEAPENIELKKTNTMASSNWDPNSLGT